MLARLRIGTRSGQPAKAACGARPTSSASATGAWRSTASSSAASASASWSSTLHETCATPPRAARVRPMARRPGRPRRAALADGARDRLRVGAGRLRAELEVEGHQRRAGGDEDSTGGRVHAVGPEVGPQAVGHPLREAGGSALAQLGARAPAGQQRRRGRRAGRARRGRRPARAPRPARRRAASRSGRRSGATSMAPTCG